MKLNIKYDSKFKVCQEKELLPGYYRGQVRGYQDCIIAIVLEDGFSQLVFLYDVAGNKALLARPRYAQTTEKVCVYPVGLELVVT